MATVTETQIKKEKENPRKRSAEDREIEEWAKKLMTRQVPQIGVPGQNGGAAALPDIPLHAGFDIDSAIGRFQWVIIGPDKYIPCIFRNGIKYCCVRMVESSVMSDLLNVLPQEIYHSAKLCSHFATQAEAKLLSYINQWHCDLMYGPTAFTEKDLVVTLQEVKEFYEYLTFAYIVLVSGGQNKANDFSRCGFVRVNNENLIPYTILKNDQGDDKEEKGVPLFYFEGQTDILKAKAKLLSGWDLAYLKVCCKVQGVRKELIAGDELLIVKLSDLKSYFPKRTVFTENCWPPGKGKSLLPKQNLNGLLHSQSANRAGSQAMVTGMSTTTPTTVVRGPAGIVNGNGIHGISTNANNFRRDINVNISGAQVRPPQVVNNYARPTTATASMLQKIKATDQLPAGAKVVAIPEVPDGAKPGAFALAAVPLDGKTFHCINFKAFHPEPRMILLPYFVNTLFPGLPINSFVVPTLGAWNIPVYLPNTSQINVLNHNGYHIQRNWEMPLVSVSELESKFQQVKNILLTAARSGRIPSNNIQYVTANSVGQRAVYPSSRR